MSHPRATILLLASQYLVSSLVAILSLFVLGVVLLSHGPIRGVLIASVPLILSSWTGLSARRQLRALGLRPWMFWLASMVAGGISFLVVPAVSQTLPWVLS